MPMNESEAMAFVGTIDAEYGCFISTTGATLPLWIERLQEFDEDRAGNILRKMCQIKKKNDIVPQLHQFTDLYNLAYNNATNAHTETIEGCGNCTKGLKTILTGSNHYPYLKPISIERHCHKGDTPETLYRYYCYERVPCECNKGSDVNDKCNYGYDFTKRKNLSDNAFISEIAAMDFFAPVLYKLRVRECKSVEALEILWNDLFKYQMDKNTSEGKVFIRITNNRKQQLEGVKT